MKKRTQIILRACIALVVVALGIIAFWQMNVMAERDTNERLVAERRTINIFLWGADNNFQKSMYFETKEDDSGRPYTVCVLSSELDDFLGELVDAYNADPTTELKVTEEELRLWLTDDILKSISRETKQPALEEFIYWTKASADLVYRGSVTNFDGSVSNAGDPVEDPNTNYDYLKRKDTADKNLVYRFEHEASK